MTRRGTAGRRRRSAGVRTSVAAGPRGRLLAVRRPAALGSAGLALALAVAGTIGASVAIGTTGPDERRGRLTPERLTTLVAASRSCPTVGPARLAGQIMATSGFDPDTRTARGGTGIAGLTDQEWERWAPWPGADRTDPAAHVHALARHMCDLVGGLRLAAVPGDAWLNGLAAFETGPAAVRREGGVPDRAAEYVRTVTEHTAWYAVQPELVAATLPTPRRTVLAAGSSPRPGAAPTGGNAPPGANAPTGANAPPEANAPSGGSAPPEANAPTDGPTARPTAGSERNPGGGAPGTRTAAPPPPAVARPVVTELSRGARVAAGGSIPGYPAALVVDGDRETYWEGPPGVFPQEVRLDLGRSRTVTSVVVRLPSEPSWNSRTQEIAVSTAPEGGDFGTVAPTAAYVFDVTKGNVATIPVRASTARHVRLTFVSTSGRQPWAPQAGEIVVYGT